MIRNFRLRFMISSFIVLLLSYFVLGHSDKMQVQAATLETTSSTETINAAVSAFQQIGSLRREEPINAEAILDVYMASLQALVQQVDAAHGLALDSDILVAIDEIDQNIEPKLAAQVIDKTLQRVFFLAILDRVTSVRGDFETANSTELNQTWDEAVAAFEAIKGTAARENKIISADRQSIETGANPGLDVQITVAFERGRTALNKENPAEDQIELNIVRQIIRLSLARAYYIGVLREVDGILSNRDRDTFKAREKQKEGEVFYRIIEEFVTKNNITGSEWIKFQFTGDIQQVMADTIVSELGKGFMRRVLAEVEANASSIADNRGRAMEVAEEALLYANIFIDDLELRLGTDSRSSLENALNNLTVASSATDIVTAEQARQTITDILATYETQLAVAGYQKTQDVPFVDAAVTAFQTIGSLRRQNPVDAQAIQAAYNGELKQLTQFIDAIYALTLDNEIQAAINAIGNAQQVPLAAQIIDKTLQRVFALTLYNRVTLVMNSFDNLPTDELELEWDRAFTAFQAVKGTMARENKVLTADRQSVETGSHPHLDSQMTLAFIRGKDVLNGTAPDSAEQIAIESERIVLQLVRGFFIGVLREVEGIIENRDREINKALEKQTEGIHFYRIVDVFISEHNPQGNALIKSQLTGDLSVVVADQIVSEISKGLVGRINDQLIQHERTFDSNLTQAKQAAEITALYMQMILPDVDLRIGSTQRITIENALQDLKEATDNNDQAKATTARQRIVDVISEYQSHLI